MAIMFPLLLPKKQCPASVLGFEGSGIRQNSFVPENAGNSVEFHSINLHDNALVLGQSAEQRLVGTAACFCLPDQRIASTSQRHC